MKLCRKKVIGVLAIVAGLVLAIISLWPWVTGLITTNDYAALARSSADMVAHGTHNTSQDSLVTSFDQNIDWNQLRSQNSSVAAWVRVENTSIDYPVVSSDDLSYYLKHDFWGKQSYVGCPFIDPRTNADATHVLIYAHHFTFGGMFSDLANRFNQDEFDKLGKLVYVTPEHNTSHLVPLCALRQDKSYGAIQQFSFDGQYDLQAWLEKILADSQAQAPNAHQMIKHSTRAVTLITCASDLEGQRPRSIVVFVDG